MNNPSDRKYAKTDEWAKIDGNIVTIGVSDYAQEQLSDVVYVEITVDVDDEVKKESIVATLESVKAAADVNSPISGKVVEINESLAQNPELVNSDPYNSAWMIKVEAKDPSALNDLMDAEAYNKYCEERSQ